MSGQIIRVDVHLEPDDAARALEADVCAGLTASPKTLPPKWFYDDRGSELFDRITRLGETAKTRATAGTDPLAAAHYRQIARDVARYLENPGEYAPKSSALPQPPGAPLGAR